MQATRIQLQQQRIGATQVAPIAPAYRQLPLLRKPANSVGPLPSRTAAARHVGPAASTIAPALLRRATTAPRTVRAAAASVPAEPVEVPGTSTFVQAVLNCVNVMMGVGLLTLPFALNSSGWIGIGLLWLMGIVCNYTGKALTECALKVAKEKGLPSGKVGYEEIAEAAFGSLGKALVSAIIYVELFGTCCLLFILEGDNLFKMLGTKLASSPSAYMLLAALVMIPTMWLPDVSSLAFLGVFGVTATVTVSLSVAYTFFSGNFAAGAPTAMAKWATLPLVFGIMTFCYSGHGVFPAIRSSMKEPEHFPQVLNVAFLIVAATCTFIGGAGYYMYGSGAADVVIFNLPGILAVVCSCLTLVNPVAKFAITCEPVAAAFVRTIGNPQGIQRAIARTALAIAILMAARTLPFLAHLMALVGSFMTVSVSVTFPVICHQILFSKQNSGGLKAWNYFVAMLGIACSALGTYSSMRSLAAKAAGGA